MSQFRGLYQPFHGVVTIEGKGSLVGDDFHLELPRESRNWPVRLIDVHWDPERNYLQLQLPDGGTFEADDMSALYQALQAPPPSLYERYGSLRNTLILCCILLLFVGWPFRQKAVPWLIEQVPHQALQPLGLSLAQEMIPTFKLSQTQLTPGSQAIITSKINARIQKLDLPPVRILFYASEQPWMGLLALPGMVLVISDAMARQLKISPAVFWHQFYHQAYHWQARHWETQLWSQLNQGMLWSLLTQSPWQPTELGSVHLSAFTNEQEQGAIIFAHQQVSVRDFNQQQSRQWFQPQHPMIWAYHRYMNESNQDLAPKFDKEDPSNQ